MLEKDIIKIGKKLKRLVFWHGPFHVHLECNRNDKPRTWSVFLLEHGIPYDSESVKLPDGTRIGGPFKSLVEGWREVGRVMDTFDLPLTRREIKHHFNLAWIRKEEQGKQLIKFRELILKGDYKKARRVCRGFSHYTMEAVPSRVLYKLGILR